MAVGFLACLLLASPAWEIWKGSRPLTEEQVDARIRYLQYRQVELRNDMPRAVMQCQETQALLGPQAGQECLATAQTLYADTPKEIAAFEGEVRELRAYVPR